MQVTQESLFLTLTDGNTFASTFASFAASLLGVNVSYIEVMDLTLDPGTSITSTTQASISVRGDFIVAPADSYSADMVSHTPALVFFCMVNCNNEANYTEICLKFIKNHSLWGKLSCIQQQCRQLPLLMHAQQEW